MFRDVILQLLHLQYLYLKVHRTKQGRTRVLLVVLCGVHSRLCVLCVCGHSCACVSSLHSILFKHEMSLLMFAPMCTSTMHALKSVFASQYGMFDLAHEYL